MPSLYDLMDEADLQERISQGLVRRQSHPYEPLAILNYTERTTFTRAWDHITLHCRGLIYNTETLEVVARPFPKFFNYEEVKNHPELLGEVNWESLSREPVVVTDKLDGSLGILYREPSTGLPSIATRGSFTSPQAKHATELFRHKYFDSYWKTEGRWADHYTDLFEIIYQKNRIVLDYGPMDDLVHLGSVMLETGETFGPGNTGVDQCPFPVAERFPERTLEDALKREPRSNAEGVVIQFLYSDIRLKIKQADYISLHRVMTGTTSRLLWEHLAVNNLMDDYSDKELVRLLGLGPDRIKGLREAGDDWLSKLLQKTPEEFTDWVTGTVSELGLKFANLEFGIKHDWNMIVQALPMEDGVQHGTGVSRGAFARAVNLHSHRGALFSLYDGRDIRPYVWKSIYPDAESPFKAIDGNAD